MFEVHLLELNKHLSQDVSTKLMQMISSEKRERINQFHCIEDAERSLLGDVLVRKLIKDKLGVANHLIKFSANEYGKPFLENAPHFHYNLSHSGKYIACAISDVPVGIDVEELKPINMRIAERFFSSGEVEYILSKPGKEQKEAFYSIWTMKEAYIKYKGKGLGIPLNSFNALDLNMGIFIHCIYHSAQAICHICSENIVKPSVINIKIERLLTDTIYSLPVTAQT